MIVVKLMGGMGNQMFQYAFALSLAKNNNAPLYIDRSFLEDKQSRPGFSNRDYSLGAFRLSSPVRFATADQVAYLTGLGPHGHPPSFFTRIKRKLNRPRHLIDYSLVYNPSYREFKGDVYLEGYFQSEKYFSEIEDLVRHEYRFREELLPVSSTLAETIRKVNAVCVHVRRTDFIAGGETGNIHGFSGLHYYHEARARLEQTEKDLHYFVFSDDIDWCKDNFGDFAECTFVSSEHAGKEAANYFQLMTLCRHFIIPNSTYSWWAAWLSSSPSRKVIAPAKWLADSTIDVKDLIPEKWIRI